MSPPLPAAATTTTPCCESWLDSTESPSCDEPKSEPSDMLTTSSRSDGSPSPFGSSAQSSAAPTSWVEPAQPKTRSPYSEALGATPGPIFSVPNGVVLSYGPVNVVPSALTP